MRKPCLNVFAIENITRQNKIKQGVNEYRLRQQCKKGLSHGLKRLGKCPVSMKIPGIKFPHQAKINTPKDPEQQVPFESITFLIRKYKLIIANSTHSTYIIISLEHR